MIYWIALYFERVKNYEITSIFLVTMNNWNVELNDEYKIPRLK